jgi:hypothetical protein
VFELVGGAWTQLGADLDGLGVNDGHGWALALSDSGTRVVVGAPIVSAVTGTAHVYEYAGGVWTALGAPVTNNHEFAHAVDISGTGNRIAVSSPHQQASDGWPGRVEVFEWSGTAWMPLGAPIMGPEAGGTAGESVSFSADGNLLAIGASTSDAGGTNAGAVRVMSWNAATSSWIQVGNQMTGPAGSLLGSSVSLSADGMRLVAGGPSGGGAARLFTFAGGTWTQAAGPDFGMGARTGHAVAISADGRTGAVGAPYADAPGNVRGAVRIYDLP